MLHRRLGDVRVGFAHSAPFVAPREPATPLDRMAARLRDLVLNDLPVRGARPFDFLGLNYYARSLVHWRPKGSAALFGTDWLADDQGAPRRFSDMGWEIFPEGLLLVLRKFARLGVPLVVSENGLATRDEEARTRFLLDHLAALARALREGIDVRGYFWWSLMDNFEWALGRGPRFGLCETDYATLERRPRPIASVYREICLTGRLPAVPPSPGR
ncbi:Beta-glucosidase [bacterium HR39]|nr:Beta-glucosidase [bacterium HR39]